MMAKPFWTLRKKMSPGAQARAAAKADQMIRDMMAERIKQLEAEVERLRNPQVCKDCEGRDCEKCGGTGFRCVNCLTYTRAADLWDAVLQDTKRERDEALAQVAVLVQALENVLYAQLGGHLNPTDDGKKVLNTIRPLQSQTPREARARALLDRLQRAEAVVEALREELKTHDEVAGCYNIPGHNGCWFGRDEVVSALATWEDEGT